MQLLNYLKRIALASLFLAAPAIASAPWSDAALITNGTATGSLIEWSGGAGVFVATGTFGGATITLKVLGPDGATLTTAGTGTTCTSACISTVYLPHCFIEAVVAGGTPSALYVALGHVN